ncbi:ester cyclase [Mameliella sp. AT18]|uniref:ester cyclase n=1 Tax=Mameliella sp. AT18 TaxID=3028385 RepID=UPI0009F63A24|nr:ester cyclase [Mameliella sp. AT18]MDD9730682.1 ester cyclase [Mameliella sp. AT18]
MTTDITALKRSLHRDLSALCESGQADLGAQLAALYHPEVEVRAAHPINEGVGLDFLTDSLWRPLMAALPDLERRDLIVMGGEYEGRTYVAMMGHYCGTFRKDWLTIPATGRPIYLRYGEVHEIRDGKIVQTNCLWDVLDVIRQAGFWPLAPSLGTEGMWPGPITGDGLIFTPQDPEEGASSIAQTLAMHGTLAAYDDFGKRGREGLLTMPQKDHWHPMMMWYGPSGIGTTRGLQGFVDYHQLPFRRAFPGRKGGGQWDEIAELKARHKGGHYIRVGDGPYSVTGGWPSVFATHDGPDFLGLAATGRPVMMRVMDFYLHHQGLIRENWVPLDILDLLMQMGVDVLDRMQSHFCRGAGLE